MKYLTSIAGAAVLAVSSFNVNAATVTAGGVVWDDVGASGILGNFNFQQWFSTAAYSSGSSGQSTIVNNTSSNIFDPTALLTGIGVFTSLNDGRNQFSSSYCANVAFPNTCALTFAFGGLQVASLTPGAISFDTSSAWLNVYFQQPAPASSSSSTSSTFYTNFAAMQNGTLWASFKFDNAVLRAQSLTGSGGFFEATLSVTGGETDVVTALDRNNGISDIYINSQAAFSQAGTGYSTGGSGRVELIPTPASIALLGLGLLGLASTRRFAKAKN